MVKSLLNKFICKTRIGLLALFCSVIIVLTACDSGETNEGKGKKPPNITIISSNPNGSSELALLMKELYMDMRSMRNDVLAGQLVMNPDILGKIKKLPTATPTEEDMKPPAFDAFSNVLLDAASKLEKAESSDQIAAYNLTLDRCLACHDQSCPGPIGKIEKLKILLKEEE